MDTLEKIENIFWTIESSPKAYALYREQLSVLKDKIADCEAKYMVRNHSGFCWCLACDPVHGEMGLECKKQQEKQNANS